MGKIDSFERRVRRFLACTSGAVLGLIGGLVLGLLGRYELSSLFGTMALGVGLGALAGYLFPRVFTFLGEVVLEVFSGWH